MSDTKSDTRATATRPALHMSWVQVRDESGRVHMEARWSADAPHAQRLPAA